MATEKSAQFNITVPLGDKDHPNEEKGTTKVVRRTLTGLKGSTPKRTGIVFWRGEHYAAAEDASNAGHFNVTGKAKKSDVPETTTTKEPAKPRVRKVVAKGSRKGASKSSNKESDRRRRAA